MSESLFSPSWYRVSRLRPRIRGHTRIYRHEYRGEDWYVLQDHAKGRYYRFTPVAYHVIGLMSGKRTVQEIWELASERFGDDGPTQGDVVQLMSQLHAADVLLCNVPPDTEELLKRSERIHRSKWKQNLRSPLALRFPLLDPERFLQRTAAFARPLFGPLGAILWIGVVGLAVVLAGLHWSELTENVVDRVLTAQNILALWLVYPVVKALHEFGHAYAVKTWGGEVHEMGIMLLVLMPVPYVDASAASEFRARHRRVIVGAAGIIVELFLASLALFLWLAAEPGIMRTFAYNVVLIGSVSTLLFNANPLLRFDGYYIFSDLLGIPNLAQRGMAYLGYVAKRYALGLKRLTAPYAGPGERFWFVVYSIAAFIYRMFVYTAIILFIAGKFFVIGILLAAWAAFSMVVLPAYKGTKFVLTSPVVREKRPRAVLLSAGALAVVLVLLFVVPFPLRTRAEGVVWVPEEAIVRAGASGFVEEIVSEPDSRVEAGDVLIRCRDPLLAANVGVLRARVEELRSRYDAAVARDQVQAQIVRRELEGAREALEREQERLEDLVIRSPVAGRFVLPKARDFPGRHLKQGSLAGYVLEAQAPVVRAVVPQSNVDLVRSRTVRVEVRLAERLDEVFPASIRREVPEAVQELPSVALGAAGGGEIAIDPTGAGGTRTFEKLFQFDLAIPSEAAGPFVGGRVYVRFDHGMEPVGFQLYRSARQLFLRRFNV